jgi:hypothetical protein
VPNPVVIIRPRRPVPQSQRLALGHDIPASPLLNGGECFFSGKRGELLLLLSALERADILDENRHFDGTEVRV